MLKHSIYINKYTYIKYEKQKKKKRSFLVDSHKIIWLRGETVTHRVIDRVIKKECICVCVCVSERARKSTRKIERMQFYMIQN